MFEQQIAEVRSKLGRLSTKSVRKPTLVYFDINGTVWPLRVLFKLADVEIDDIQISTEVWAGAETPASFSGDFPLKNMFTFGHVPCYVDKDVDFSQSLVIMEYLGKKISMLGNSLKEELLVKELLCHSYDCIYHTSGIFHPCMKLGKPEEVHKFQVENFMNNGYHKNLLVFQKYLRSNPISSDFMVGCNLTLADLVAFNVICNWYKAWDRKLFVTDYEDLDSYIHKIASTPEIADYIKNGQAPTTFIPGEFGKAMGHKLTTPEELTGLVKLPGIDEFQAWIASLSKDIAKHTI